MRIADAHGDRPGVDVAEINVPAILAIFGASAGEGGHPSIEARDVAQGKPTFASAASWCGCLAWPWQCGLRRSPRQRGSQGERCRAGVAKQMTVALTSSPTPSFIVSSRSIDKGLRHRSPLLCLVVVVDYGLAAITVSIFLLDHGRLAVTRLPLLDDSSTVTVTVAITIVRFANRYASADGTDANTNILRKRGRRDSDNRGGGNKCSK
jgi:hypothetical protein